METKIAVRPKKSEALTEFEWEALKKYRSEFDTGVACALAIGIDRDVLSGILLRGSGRPDKIKRIRKIPSVKAVRVTNNRAQK